MHAAVADPVMLANAIRLIARLSRTKFADQLADGFVTALAGFGRK